jgi:hypothetical protein
MAFRELLGEGIGGMYLERIGSRWALGYSRVSGFEVRCRPFPKVDLVRDESPDARDDGVAEDRLP